VKAVKSQPGMASYSVLSTQDYLSMMTPSNLPGFRPFIGIVIGVSVTIGFLVIFQAIYTAVMERTREIGIRKAIGAARKEIMYQFLIESFLISGGGAVIGILLGIALPVAVQYFFLPANLRVPVSSLSVVIAFVVSCSTGLFFGYLPANQAASLQPVESLRYE
jgi:putative ABC transport system permease protein